MMHELTKNWKARSLIIMIVFLVVCGLIYLLDGSDWANGVRLDALNETMSEQKNTNDNSGLLVFFVSFIKEFVLIGVPMAIAIGIGHVFKRVKTKFG